MREDYVMCRLALHAWEEVGDDSITRPEEPGWWWLVLQCVRCDTKRYDLITSSYEVWTRRYKYPNGYQIDEKVTRSDMRREWAYRHHADAIEVRRNTRNKTGRKSR